MPAFCHEPPSRFDDEHALVCRDGRDYSPAMDKLRADLLHAWRSLMRRRAYFLTCAATFALVLGANAAIFAAVSATLIRPLPFTAGDRIVKLYMLPPGMSEAHQRNPLQQMDLVRFRERTRTMKRIEGFLRAERVVTGAGEPALVRAAAVTPGLLEMMGITTVSGRVFRPEEASPGGTVAMVTERYQRSRGTEGAVGSTLTIDGTSYTIVGVTPEGFPPPFLEADVFIPLVADPTPTGRNPLRSVVAIAELADGATVAQASEEADRIVRDTARELPRTHGGWTGGAQPMREWLYGAMHAPILVLFGAAGLVLLIACANIASLTSAQAASRAGDLALRIALGASRADVLRLQILELVIVALGGAIPGLLLADYALPVLLAIDPAAARTLGPVSIDWRVQAFTLALAMTAAILAGVIPAIHGFRGSSASRLGGARRGAGSPAARRLRRVLVATEVALCIALLMAGVVLMDSLRQTSRLNPGYNPAAVLTAQIRLSPTAHAAPEARAQVVGRILENIRGIPGVLAASTTMNDFIPGNAYQTNFHIEGRPRPDGQPHSTQFRRVSPEYFDVMQIRQLRGRSFTSSDGAGTPDVAVISRLLAEGLFPGEDPVGRVIRRTGAEAPRTTIIGVVDDVSDVSLTQPPEPTLYLAWAQNNTVAVPVTFVIRAGGDPANIVRSLRTAVLSVDPAMPLRRVQTLETFLEDSVAPHRFRTTVLGIISILGLALAALGIYGVSYRSVVDRTPEIAVRLALGSAPSKVMRLLVSDSMRDVAVGTAMGVVLGGLLCGVLQRMLTNAAGADVGSVALATSVLAGAALLATLIPARRVWRVEPADALR
jgi:putative ABC transport system permease protein